MCYLSVISYSSSLRKKQLHNDTEQVDYLCHTVDLACIVCVRYAQTAHKLVAGQAVVHE